MKERDRRLNERLSVLDRARSHRDHLPDNIPSVARWSQRLSDPSAARLALAEGQHRVYLGLSDRNGVEHIEVHEVHESGGGGGCAFPRNVLAQRGAGGITVSSGFGGDQIVHGVVPDEVLEVHVGENQATLSNNVFFARVDTSPEEVVLVTAHGERQWPLRHSG